MDMTRVRVWYVNCFSHLPHSSDRRLASSHLSLNTDMAAVHVSSSLYTSIHDAYVVSCPARTTTLTSRLPLLNSTRIRSNFVTGSPLRTSVASLQRTRSSRTSSLTVRCEQSTKDGNGLDVWLGRLAMVGFASAITVEVATGKGLLQNFGLTSPLPTVALAVTALVGVLTAIFIFQSASDS